ASTVPTPTAGHTSAPTSTTADAAAAPAVPAPTAGHTPAPTSTTADAAAEPVAGGGADRARPPSSPLARRIAREKGIDLAALSGSGPGGRIVRADVEAAA